MVHAAAQRDRQLRQRPQLPLDVRARARLRAAGLANQRDGLARDGVQRALLTRTIDPAEIGAGREQMARRHGFDHCTMPPTPVVGTR